MTLSQPPRPLFWYEQPGHIHIKLFPGEVSISPMGHDTVIKKEVDGQVLKALVPTHTVQDFAEGCKYVPAQVAGKKNNVVILYLPTSNEGRPTWAVREDLIEEITVNPH